MPFAARGPSGAFPEEVGAAGASLVGARLVVAAAEEAFLAEGLPSAAAAAAAAALPCRAAGRTLLVLLRGRAPSLMLGACRAAVPSRVPRIYLLRRRLRADAAAARALRRRLLNAARGALRRLTAFDFAGRGSCASLAARSSRYWDVPRAVFALFYGCGQTAARARV